MGKGVSSILFSPSCGYINLKRKKKKKNPKLSSYSFVTKFLFSILAFYFTFSPTLRLSKDISSDP